MDSSRSSDAPSDFAPLILPHQRSVYEKLLAIGRACFSIQLHTLPLRPRTQTLIVAQTGSGKTFMARAAAGQLGVPFLSLTASNWMLLGSAERGSEVTWRSVFQFLYENRNAPGAVIFLDEVDKLTGATSWDVHLRVEIFGLLDRILPVGLKDGAGDLIGNDARVVAQDILANRTLVVAAGAFQDHWEKRSLLRMGFGESSPDSSPLTSHDLVKTIPREIINRFRREILIIPELRLHDYEAMLDVGAAQIPAYLRQTFLQLGKETIPQAMETRQGCRFLEDLLLDTILAERASLQEVTPKPVLPEKNVGREGEDGPPS